MNIEPISVDSLPNQKAFDYAMLRMPWSPDSALLWPENSSAKANTPTPPGAQIQIRVNGSPVAADKSLFWSSNLAAISSAAPNEGEDFSTDSALSWYFSNPAQRDIVKLNAVCGLTMAQSNACSGTLLSSLTDFIYVSSPVNCDAKRLITDPARALPARAKIQPHNTEIEDARKEIESLLEAMSRGEILTRSDDVMDLCGRLADQLKKSAETVEIPSWSDKLAADLGKFTD